ncbi:MAG: shikimate kinase [Bacteroidetes bacterium]|nr:shikimate kinase [Bacteroidota bacterium]
MGKSKTTDRSFKNNTGMRIYLIGFMGCGKTSIGRELAGVMKLRFIDLDEYIEKTEQRPVSDIFKLSGERYFRRREHIALKELSGQDDFVLATGGGTPCFHGNIYLLNRTGISVWFRTGEETLFSRLYASAIHRPLIKDLTPSELTEFIKTTLSAREPFYRKAGIIIDGIDTENTKLSVTKITEQISSYQVAPGQTR